MTQHHCDDPPFHDILKMLRHWHLSEQQLHDLQHQQLVCTSQVPTEDAIARIYDDHSDAVFLTVSRAAAKFINTIIAQHVFQHMQPLAQV